MTHNLCWRDIWFDPVNYYEIDDAGNVTTISTELPAPIIYESTNGSIYVILKSTELKKGEYVCKPYKLDMLMLWTFSRDTFINSCIREDETPESALFIDIIHKDGNQFNNNINNLEAHRPEEKWIPLIFGDVVKDRYEISTFGRVRQKKNANSEWKILTIYRNSDPDGYHVYSLKVFPFNPKSPCKNKKRHIIIAAHFVSNPNPEIYTQVNHINGCKTDNSLYNLEWVTPHMNTRHAIMCKLSPNQQKLSTAEIDMIRDMLFDPQYEGSPVKVFGSIDTRIHPDITKNIIYSIKANNRAYVRTDSKYGIDPIEFPKCIGKGRISNLTKDVTDLLDKMYTDPIYIGSNGKVNKQAICKDFGRIYKEDHISSRMVYNYLLKFDK